jgi:hypothetical protein
MDLAWPCLLIRFASAVFFLRRVLSSFTGEKCKQILARTTGSCGATDSPQFWCGAAKQRREWAEAHDTAKLAIVTDGESCTIARQP